MLQAAMARHADLIVVGGSPRQRLGPALWFVLSGGPWRIDAAYVETSTTSAMPWDMALLALVRSAPRPVGIYFRDAYQLFRRIYRRPGLRAWLSDTAWRLTTAMLRSLATVSFAPSQGLADQLHLRAAVLLPPGTDPSSPDLGVGDEPLVAYVGARSRAIGFDLLVDAMGLVRREKPEVRLVAIGPADQGDPGLPDWIELRTADRDGLADALRPARVCVIPLPINAYTNLARPVRLTDFLAFGKPIVATDAAETRATLGPTQAGLLVEDTPEAIAAGLLRVLSDRSLAAQLAARARTLAIDPHMTWDCRAEQALAPLLENAPRRAD
jgi:glycosyltransferase involved in cell wall biosynthesis